MQKQLLRLVADEIARYAVRCFLAFLAAVPNKIQKARFVFAAAPVAVSLCHATPFHIRKCRNDGTQLLSMSMNDPCGAYR
jgi:hypothetical protein